ncbi:MAG: DnaB-like helicase C-terminal domain-containing protein [Desulfuromonadaceae bacterium]
MSNAGEFHDIQLEKELVGNLLNDNASFLEICDTLRPDDFFNSDMAKSYQAYGELYQREKQIDLTYLVRQSGVNASILVECIDAGFLAANIQWRARQIKTMSQRRKMHRSISLLQQQVGNLEPLEMANRLSEVASEIALTGGKKRVYSTLELSEIVARTQHERATEPGHIKGIKTGLHFLDKTLRGLQPKSLTLIAAATGFGKTTLALNLYANIAKQGRKILFISNENDVVMNLDRLSGIAGSRPLKEITSGFNPENVVNEFRQAFDTKHMYLSDNAPRTIDEVCGLIRKYSIQHGVEAVIYDYIGETALAETGEANRMESEEQRLARWTAQLLQTARAQDVHLILVAQLNRQGNAGGKPTKTELAGCFRMAQKAHSMLLFWQDTNGQDVLTVEKNRTGQAGVNIAVTFNRPSQKIWDTGFYDTKAKQVLTKSGALPAKHDGRAAAAGEKPEPEPTAEQFQEMIDGDLPF